jgi:hypothetical protein
VSTMCEGNAAHASLMTLKCSYEAVIGALYSIAALHGVTKNEVASHITFDRCADSFLKHCHEAAAAAPTQKNVYVHYRYTSSRSA